MSIPEEMLGGEIVQGSGNVFADLGDPDAGEKQAKVRLAMAINQAIADRGLTQAMAAQLLGTEQPKISALANFKLAGFSLERLTAFLNALAMDVEIVIHPPDSGGGRGRTIVRSGDARAA